MTARVRRIFEHIIRTGSILKIFIRDFCCLFIRRCCCVLTSTIADTQFFFHSFQFTRCVALVFRGVKMAQINMCCGTQYFYLSCDMFSDHVVCLLCVARRSVHLRHMHTHTHTLNTYTYM